MRTHLAIAGIAAALLVAPPSEVVGASQTGRRAVARESRVPVGNTSLYVGRSDADST